MRRYPTLEIEEQMNALVAGYTQVTARAGGHSITHPEREAFVQS
jgi:hypothetical protein